MSIGRIDHIGVVVDDLAQGAAFLERVFGVVPHARIDRDDLTALFFPFGAVQLELIEVTESQSRQARLGDHTARIDHIAIEVACFDQALVALEAAGVQLAGPPRTVRGRQTVFTQPSTTDGIPYQFLSPR